VEQRSHVFEILRSVSMLLDNAILYDRMFKSNEALARRIGSLKRLLEISEALSGKMTPDALIDFILSAAVQEINADGGSLMLLDPRRQELVVQAIKGLPEEAKSAVRLKVGEGIAGLVAEEKEPLILLDSALLGQEYEEEYRKYAVKFFPFEKYKERRGVLSAISIPLMIKREIVGVLT
jgi:signal transduction protein with GAF and PtsI domain